MKKIILASKSPRRKELLRQVGIEFDCVPASGEEIISDGDACLVVRSLALQKAEETALKVSGEIILAADTVVAYKGMILGKPEDEADAKRMLSLLSGNVHQVYTGVCIINQHTCERKQFEVCTEVSMYDMASDEIDAYIKTGEPLDKAGAYAIQGRCAAYIREIRGDYYNVVGLPVASVYQVLKLWL